MTALKEVMNRTNISGKTVLFDKIINVVLYSSQDPTRRFEIRTPVTGPKPDITVSYKMLEGEKTAYDIQVDIVNISQDKSFNVYDYDLMDVEIGYRTNGTNATLLHSMSCAIFLSYASVPNPNGVTTFRGIVGTHMRDVFVRKPIYVIINKASVTVSDLVNTIAHVIGHTTSIPDSIKDYELFFKHNEAEYSANQVHYKAENGAALLSWLQGIITQTGEARNEKWSVSVYDNCLYVIGDMAIDAPDVVKAVPINAMNSMTLTGNIADVDAPYNPQVYPGAIVTIKPSFYTASLPNSEMSKYVSFLDDLGNRHDQAYRVLTMEVKFGTYQDNNMKFKALGGESVYTGAEDKVTTSMSTSSAREQARNLIEDRLHKQSVTVTDIEANLVQITSLQSSASVLESAASVQIQFGVYIPRVLGELNTFLALSATFANGGQDVTILNNTSTFSSLAAEYYEGKYAYKEVSRTDNAASEPPLAPVPDDNGGFDNPKIPCEFFAPVIALATYAQYLAKGGDSSGYANVAECLTSSIPNGKVACIPNVPDDITTNITWAMAFRQYANVLLKDKNSGVAEADIASYQQIAFYMEAP